MPRGDGTGPTGLGPMTGRAAGFCAGYPVPGYMNPVGGRGYWGRGRGFWGRGGGRGWRNRYWATGLPGRVQAGYGWPSWGGFAGAYAPQAGPFTSGIPAEQELGALKQQADYFEGALEDIKKRIEQLEAESSK